MKKIFLAIILFSVAINCSNAQQLSKDEKKKLKAELKNYEKNLEAYKARMDEIRNTMDSNEAQIRQLKEDTTMAGAVQTELENKVYAYEAKIKDLEAENDTLKTEIKSAPDMTTTPKQGTVYKVQLGMYKMLDLTKYFEQPRSIGYEAVDGMNRYVIGYFADENEAKNFVKDIRRLGIKDAFVSKYIDGVRVFEWSENPKYKGKKVPNSLQDALDMEKAKGHHKN